MKKTISFLFAGLLLAGTSFAQKGSILVAGSLAFQDSHSPSTEFNNQDGQRSWNFGITPQVGYQFSNAWTVGIIGGYTHNEDRADNGSFGGSGNTWSVGPFLRYTRPITSWVSFYGEFNGEYFNDGPLPVTATATANTYTLGASVFPALFFNIKNGFGINVNFGGIQYDHNHASGIGNTGSSFNLTFGNTAVIGISKNFGGRKKS